MYIIASTWVQWLAEPACTVRIIGDTICFGLSTEPLQREILGRSFANSFIFFFYPSGSTEQIYFIFNLCTAAFKAYCAIWDRCSNFRHQASPRVSPCKITERRKVELWARYVWDFCLNADFQVTFRDLLHAVKLRHGTDGFTSSPKGGVLRIFSPQISDGFGWVRTHELVYQRPARYL
jgi:hypothetical protein